MMENKEELVRQRAYQIWEREGKREGFQNAHWVQASEEIEATYAEDKDRGTPPGSALEQQSAGPAETASDLPPGGSAPSGGQAAGIGSVGTTGTAKKKR